MKSVFALIVALFASQSFAGETVCYNNSNSDLEIRMIFDGSRLSRVSWINQDWGAAGWGDLQGVALNKNNDYVVVSKLNGPGGFDTGTIIQLKYQGSVLNSAEVFANLSSPEQSETYRCP